MEELTPEKIDSLKAEHGQELRAVVDQKLGTFVFRCPTKAEFRQYTDAVNSDRPTASGDAAAHRLSAHCCVWPSREAWTAVLDKKPGLCIRALEMIGEMNGLGSDVETKKL